MGEWLTYYTVLPRISSDLAGHTTAYHCNAQFFDKWKIYENEEF